jgi:hypothetical protein
MEHGLDGNDKGKDDMEGFELFAMGTSRGRMERRTLIFSR